MLKTITLVAAIISFAYLPSANAQEAKKSKKTYFNTSAGVNKIQGKLVKTFKHSIAFNSGIEREFGKHWFVQADLSFNTVKYDQQKKDEHSNFLFQKTNSSLITAGVNVGRNFYFGESGIFASPYVGVGALNIGEPRLNLDELTGIIKQDIIRQTGIIGRGGARIAYSTKSKFFQTIYADGSYWTSSLKINQLTVRSISVFVGIRMAM